MRFSTFSNWILWVALLVITSGCSYRSGNSVLTSAGTVFSQDYDSSLGSYKLNYTYQLPTDPSQLDFIELREVDSTVYPNANLSSCTVGIPVRTWNSPFTASQSLTGFYLAGSQNKFRYVLCQWKKDGTVTGISDGGTAASAQSLISPQSTTYTATKVTSGQYFSCALFSNGRVKCWGNNQYGQLGLGDTNNRGDGPGEMGSNLPYLDLGSSGGVALQAIDIQAGLNHACALLSNGGVKCWGRNQAGQLGYGDTTQRGATASSMGNNLGYVDLGSHVTAKSLAVGGDFSCAVLTGNQLKCLGDNGSGQLGRGDTVQIGLLPNQMGDNLAAIDLGNTHAVKVAAAGLEHICAILDNNRVKCWGLNDVGDLGLGDTNNRGDGPGEMGDNLPYVELGASFGIQNAATQISVGGSHSCVTTWLYQVKCWGDNFAGELGLGTTTAAIGDQAGEMGDNLAVVDFGSFIMSFSQPVVKLQVGLYTTCAQLWTSDIKCWGANHFGQLGLGSSQTTWGTATSDMGLNLPSVSIGTANYVKMFSSQYGTTCAITQDNVIKCWGINIDGALGYGDTVNRGTSSSQMGSSLPIVDL